MRAHAVNFPILHGFQDEPKISLYIPAQNKIVSFSNAERSITEKIVENIKPSVKINVLSHGFCKRYRLNLGLYSQNCHGIAQ